MFESYEPLAKRGLERLQGRSRPDLCTAKKSKASISSLRGRRGSGQPSMKMWAKVMPVNNKSQRFDYLPREVYLLPAICSYVELQHGCIA